MRHVARQGGVSADEALRRVSPRRRRERRRLSRVDGRANRPPCAGSTVTPTVAARCPGKSANNNQPSGLDVQGIFQFHSPRAGTHAGTKLATDQPVLSECTRPRPAGGEKEFANSTLRVRDARGYDRGPGGQTPPRTGLSELSFLECGFKTTILYHKCGLQTTPRGCAFHYISRKAPENRHSPRNT